MYERFFGLVDAPFRLTPDPRYLFLSRKHAEALAHLKLGLSESSGFVCITGDVGTGKTTLLRSFLRTVGSETSTAYIFNPALTAVELLQTINTELGIPASSASQKALVDALNVHLLGQREAGRRSMVVIDEAQALSIDVLEQLRLLSNLETTTEKLLRIVLVGQPQLRMLLGHPELAQLNQRITLRWHMGPLDYKETVAYVGHRLAVASRGQAGRLFTPAAVWQVHRLSHGVPRLINMIAHRALLAAFAADRRTVTARSVLQAYREIGALPLPTRAAAPRRVAWAAAAVLAVAVGVVALGVPRLTSLPGQHRPPADVDRTPPTATAPAPVEPEPAPSAAAAQAPGTPAPGEAAPSAPVPADQMAAATAPPTAIDVPPVPDTAAAPDAASPPPPAALAASGDADKPVTVAAAAPADTAPETPPPAPAAETPPPAPVAATPAADSVPASVIEERLAALPAAGTARAAVQALLAAWHARPLAPEEAGAPAELGSIATRRGLEYMSLVGNGTMLRLLDLPAVLELRIPGTDGPRYVALTGMREARAVVSLDGQPTVVDAAFLDRSWFGQAHLLWRDFEGLGVTFGREAHGPPVARVQTLLHRAGVYAGPVTGTFDAGTAAAVLNFQRARFLAPDGRVGRLTRIVLYAAAGGYPRPMLNPPPGETS
jgi:general secretion pathway protein A